MATDNGPNRDVKPEDFSSPKKKDQEHFDEAYNAPNNPKKDHRPKAYNTTDEYGGADGVNHY